MLKNKFGMTKVLVLVLSVLMLVSLVACNKADGPSTDDMNSAIQSAIDAANAEAAAREAALASSIAAAEAEAAAREAALASSLKAEAEKAAADAAAKAEAEASKEASKLAAELAAAEAAASKAQAEASKAAESAKQASIAASKAASEAAEAAKTTTGGNNPGALVDKSAVLAEYSKLKTEYTYTNRDYYLADDYAALVLLFDKASVDLNNALTVDAATSVLETLKVDAAAIESAKTAANEVQALIVALGDIETEVFTTQAEKIVAAREALEDMKVAYADYLEYDVKKEADTYVIVDGKTINKTAALIEKLGVAVDELENAESKLDVLEGFIAKALFEDMKVIHNYDIKHRFDVEDDASLIPTVKDAYYKYLVLSVLNGGDTAAADMPIDWEYKVDKEGKVQKGEYDYTKPIEWFTIDELVETYILPVLDNELYDYVHNAQTGLLVKLTAAMGTEGLYKKAPATAKPEFKDLDFDEIVDAFEEEVDAISFVEDYKGTATLDDAKADINTIAINYYIDAMNAYLAAAKVVVIEKAEEDTEKAIDAELAKIDVAETQIDATESETTIARLNTKIEGYKAQIEKLKANLEALKSNVNAATLLTYEEMLNEDLNETKAYKDKWADISDFENETAADIETFLNLVLSNTINTNFKVEIAVESDDESEQELINLINAVVADLEALRVRVSPYEDDKYDAEKKTGADIFNAWNGGRITYVEDPYYFVNTDKFIAIVETIDAAIAEIEAVSADAYTASNVKVLTSDGKKTYYYKDANAQTYAIENEWTLKEIINGKTVDGTKVTLVTNTATDFPVTYVYAPAEQASKAVVDLYVKAFQDVNAQIVALDTYAKGIKEKISKDGKTDYDLIAATVSGALKTEVEAVAAKGKADIDAAVTKFANNCSLEAKNLFVKSDKWSGNADNFVTITPSAAAFASKYNPNGYKAKVNSAFTTFEKNFFLSGADMGVEDDPDTFIDESAVLDKTQSKVIVLWNAKLEAVKRITEAVATYKNTYTALTGADNIGLYDVEVTEHQFKYQYKVDSNKVAGKDAIATAYEAELDALLATYTELIMGVEIGDGITKITDGTDAVVGTFNGKDEAGSKISYKLAQANAAIAAYEAALIGTDGYWVTANNDATKYPYNFGNSMIFKAYNTIVLNNAYGIARVRVDVAIEKVYNSAATTDGSVSISTPYYDNAITITASGVKTTYTEDGAVDKLGKAVKSIDVYKKAKNAADWTEFAKEADGTFIPDDITASYKVVVTYVDEIVLENGGEYTETDGVKTYTKGDLSTVNGFGAGTTVKVKVNGKDVKVGDTVVGKYYATDITVKVDGVALDDADIDVDEDGYFTFDVEDDAESIVITPVYAVKPNISVSCGSGIKYYVVTNEENPVWLSGETYKIQLVLEDADADLEAKNGDAAITIADDNTISVALTDTAAVAISVAVKAAE